MRMVALLIAATLFVSALTTGVALAENIVFPSDAGVLDVTKEPYNAKGDGKTDDTEALRKAYEHTGLIYIPNGTYLISDSIVAPPRRGSAPCRRVLQGQSAEKTIIRLKDRSDGFGDASKPNPLRGALPRHSATVSATLRSTAATATLALSAWSSLPRTRAACTM